MYINGDVYCEDTTSFTMFMLTFGAVETELGRVTTRPDPGLAGHCALLAAFLALTLN